MRTLIKNAQIVNEGKITYQDLLIKGDRIEKIASEINLPSNVRYSEVNANGRFLIPGVIDAQVHFREPGFTSKGDIISESKSAVAGGVTSYMDMPNTVPAVLTQKILEDKFKLAKNRSFANYSFYMGVSTNNLEEVLRTDNQLVCGVSDDGLYFENQDAILANHPEFLEKLFSESDALIALHSEDSLIINQNIENHKAVFGLDIPIAFHPKIRSEEACVLATERLIRLATKHNARLHLLHISSKAESDMFKSDAVKNKRITSEVSSHYLYFSDEDYATLGNRIKWNPSIKTRQDKEGLMKALLDGKIDMITTDHAPHTWKEKTGHYFESKSGGPLVQHSLQMLLYYYERQVISLEKIVEKMSHHVADAFKIIDRGYLREGYFADLVLLDVNTTHIVSTSNILSKCAWSPLEGEAFNSEVNKTWVNGTLVYNNGFFNSKPKGMRLQFNRDR